VLREKIVEKLIVLSQRTPFRGSGGYTREALAIKGRTEDFPQADLEASQFGEFFSYFSMPEITGWFRNKVVLDLGSGYGGKTVEYVMTLGAREVHGIEPVEKHVYLSEQYAKARNVTNCHFKVCDQNIIPFADESFDAVVSHDVLEHVADPRITLQEIHRVLKPKGKLFMVFPPYHGLRSHHLDYITKLPGLHLVFPPDVIVRAINRILSSPGGERFGTQLQTGPTLSYNKARQCLPTLNGLTSREFTAMLDGFSIVELRQLPLFISYREKLLGSLLYFVISQIRKCNDLTRDMLSSSLSCILEKRG
jgi:SAM-dependent methyltransferase